MNSGGASAPFSRRTVLVLLGFGFAVFVALLWSIGAGPPSGSVNDGRAHAGSKGLTGYSALADFLERRGHAVRLSRSEAALDDPGLLVLTPNGYEDGEKLERIVSQRRYTGPTLIVLPKWFASQVPSSTPGAKKGWVEMQGTSEPVWRGFLDDVGVQIGAVKSPDGKARWGSYADEGVLPEAGAVMSGTGRRLAPLVFGGPDDRVLAAFVEDGGYYEDLADMAVGEARVEIADDEWDEDKYPIVLVFEPDLLNNYGMASLANADFADALFIATGEHTDGTVIFDLTLNGFARSANLLTLAFTPPYLAATLCLILAALAIGWRALVRFGPALRPGRAIAFGKRALVANAAGLIRRAGRLHLIGAPYADAARERLTKALALPRQRDAVATEAAIDRALASRDRQAEPFSSIAARLRSARKAQDLLRAAKDLHALERTLTR